MTYFTMITKSMITLRPQSGQSCSRRCVVLFGLAGAGSGHAAALTATHSSMEIHY